MVQYKRKSQLKPVILILNIHFKQVTHYKLTKNNSGHAIMKEQVMFCYFYNTAQMKDKFYGIMYIVWLTKTKQTPIFELSSVGRNIALYTQGLGFEPELHLFTFKR